MNLKTAMVGDKIRVMMEFSRTNFDVYTVVRLTETQVICEPPAKFRRDNGLKIGSGDSYRRRYGTIATQADFDEQALRIRMSAAHNALQALRVTPENLEAVELMLKASKP